MRVKCVPGALIVGLVAMAIGSAVVSAQTLAFPGAHGFGRFATGGRGGSVYYVTTTNDTGAGSFRDAVSQPNRTVVFAVSGVIDYQPPRNNIQNSITIAGQTTPGDGVRCAGESSAIGAEAGWKLTVEAVSRQGALP